jgi:hypothetical protein
MAVIFVGPRHGRFVTQYEYPEGSNKWYVKAADLPQQHMRTGWVSIEFGQTHVVHEAVKGQIWR